MFETIERYEENGLGLPYSITLINAAERLVENGEPVGVRVPDLEGLAASVAISRCLCPLQLAGAEVRFVRQVLGMTQRKLADALEIDAAETISRWENGAKGAGGYTEKLLRAVAVMVLSPRVPGVVVPPDAIALLRIQPRAPDQWPRIEATRVRVRHDGAQSLEWELPLAA